MVREPLKHDLTEFPGWKRATEHRREEITAAARQFLLSHSDGYAEIGSRTNYSDPGYLAIWLLRDEVRADQELRAVIAANWIGALVGRWNDCCEPYQVTAAMAYELDAEATVRDFVRQMRQDNERHGQILCLHGFSKGWDEPFTRAALELASSGTLKPGSVESILRFVAGRAPGEASACTKDLLSHANPADAASREQLMAVLSACLGEMPCETWDHAWPHLHADEDLARSVLLRVADSVDHPQRTNALNKLSSTLQRNESQTETPCRGWPEARSYFSTIPTSNASSPSRKSTVTRLWSVISPARSLRDRAVSTWRCRNRRSGRAP